MKDYEIIKIKVCELDAFCSEYLKGGGTILPITPERIASYQNNPNGLPTDISLYCIKQQNEIIAFRTIWADNLFLESGEIRFGWCSGNWVDPDYRRKGLSQLLLKEAYNDWGEKLMFTNYAPESLNGYLKTGLFPFKINRVGKRFYFNANLIDLYSTRWNKTVLRILLIFMNFIYRCLYAVRKQFFFCHDLSRMKITLNNPVEADFHTDKSVFGRGEKQFRWIFKFPWVTVSPLKNENYPFSWKIEAFQYVKVNIIEQEEECSFILSLKNGTLKLLYWQTSERMRKIIAKWIINYCWKNSVKTLTIVDSQMAELVSKTRNPFVLERNFEMNIYSTFEIISEDKSVFDGDGDYIFT